MIAKVLRNKYSNKIDKTTTKIDISAYVMRSGTGEPKSRLRQRYWEEVTKVFIETQGGRLGAGQEKLGRDAGNQVRRLRLEREV